MIEHVLLVVFALALAVVSIRYWKVKRQIKNIECQLKQNVPRRRSISIELLDHDLETFTLAVNNLIEDYNQTLLETRKNHQYLKDSIADISHDMRTPLTSMIGYLQLLSRDIVDNKQHQYLNIALEKSQYLRNLLSDFYELSALSANNKEIKLKKIDLAGIVSEVILDNANEFAKSSITPIFESSDKPVFIMANIENLQRIIQNLVSNCLKYSSGDVKFKIEDNDTVSLIIENPAINTKEINTERLFDRFYKTDLSRNSNGTGLGLYIVKLLTQSMGGNISAHINEDLFIIKLDFLKFI